MHSLLSGFVLALALVATIDGVLDLPSNKRPRIPVYEGQCDPPFTPVEGSHCYFLSYEQMQTNWLNAQLISGPWIGAIELGDSNEFVWASSNSPIEVPNWSPSRPNSPTFGDGVALDVANFFEWVDLSNGTELPILCEIPSNPPRVALKCPDGFFLLGGGSCYAVFDNQTMSMTWDNAQTFCGALAAGGRLAELETSEEIAFMKNHLTGNGYGCNGGTYWIGAEEIGNTNTYFWTSSGQVVAFYDWYQSEPNDGASGDAINLWCLHNLQWADALKSKEYSFICEAPPVEL
ncbi:unnamed protein product [Cyprideis torosa]|uniref:Uncharacterized protein n=1 Tax=Cyprideis torosa TaxID=163714 RepID=A0A7R8ZL70_9CRUS|nr:unnamed protein product [Cyprideis torosa]CAG0892760.1 unnamed protein product [Cyprideis torosa]